MRAATVQYEEVTSNDNGEDGKRGTRTVTTTTLP
jgi:hypothetical protein